MADEIADYFDSAAAFSSARAPVTSRHSVQRRAPKADGIAAYFDSAAFSSARAPVSIVSIE